MNYELFITKSAQLDLDEIFIWYEEQKTHLGREFIEEFDQTVNRISKNPFFASLVDQEARSASLKKFPYQIVYRIIESDSQIRIIAVVHHHRNPEWFRQRLSN